MIAKNRLLAGLDPVSFARLVPHLDRVPLRRGAVLQDQFHPIEHAYFIESGVASLYARTRADGPIEVGVVGRLGLVGVSAILEAGRSPHRCVMQVPGEALRISVADLRTAMDSSPRIRHHFLSYVHALLVQYAQAALCNGRHAVEKRLCRWLLIAADRLDEKQIPITHDMLAMNLGVRRAGVTRLLGRLQKAGTIAIRRGTCEIIDRSALEGSACECYGIITAEYRRLTEHGHRDHLMGERPFAAAKNA